MSATIVFTMAEGDRSTLFSETDHDSVLSGSTCYSTELSEEGEVLSEAGSEISLSLHTEDTIHPYLFKPEQSSSEQDSETLDTVDSQEEQIGNTNWYYNEGSFCTASIQNTFYRCTCNFCHSMPTVCESIHCQELEIY